MNTITKLGTLLLMLSGTLSSFAQTTVQIIHNSADAAAASVDVYVNNMKLIEDFEYKTATTFLPLDGLFADAAATTAVIEIAIAPMNSNDVGDAIFTKSNITVNRNESYIVVADGIVSSSGYDRMTNPINSGFDLYIYSGAELTSTGNDTNNVGVLVHHGATDAPAVDIANVTEDTNEVLVDNISYSEFEGYIQLPVDDYEVAVRPTGTSIAVGTYAVPLESLSAGGGAFVVVASGFLNPSANSDGEAFGLFAIPTGNPLAPTDRVSFLVLPELQASAQLFHNVAGAPAVDVFVNGDLIFDDLAYRNATPFIDELPVDVPLNVRITPGDDDTVSLLEQQIFLRKESSNIAIINSNADGMGINLSLNRNGQEEAMNVDMVDLWVHHGSIDAGTVDVEPLNIRNIEYLNNSPYRSLVPEMTDIDIVRSGSDPKEVLFDYTVDLSSFAGQALTVIASGSVADNDFQLLAVSSVGTVIPLQRRTLTIETFKENGVVIYPNPVNTTLNINVPFAFGQAELRAFDQTGRMVIDSTFNQNDTTPLDVSLLSNGLYYLQLDINGQTLSTMLAVD